MSSGLLAGHGILVTRPEHQANELCRAIESAGGIPIGFPLLEIVNLDRDDIARNADLLPRPDLVIYVSPNAVHNGFGWQAADIPVAAVGPATRRELLARGATAVIGGSAGFDSENLLAERALANVSKERIRIVRGQDGRELLGNALRERGASIDYLAVYQRRPRRVSERERLQLENRFKEGAVSCITVMSVATLKCLPDIFPGAARNVLLKSRLVTPSSRVLKNVTELMPGLPATLARRVTSIRCTEPVCNTSL
jgi:uroporphyrinogen-III synthase